MIRFCSWNQTFCPDCLWQSVFSISGGEQYTVIYYIDYCSAGPRCLLLPIYSGEGIVIHKSTKSSCLCIPMVREDFGLTCSPPHSVNSMTVGYVCYKHELMNIL